MKKNPIVTFLTACAALFQVFFLACLTIWNDVVLIPNQIFCPPITKEYWSWYIDKYVPAVDYESQLVGVSAILNILCSVTFLLGICLVLKQAFSIKGKVLHAELILGIAAVVAYAAIFLYNRMYGQPYRMFMYVALPEVLALTLLSLSFLHYRRRNSPFSR